MPSVHKYSPIAYRPPVEVREPLLALAERTGRGTSAIITEALRRYLGLTERGLPAGAEPETRDAAGS